MHADPEVEGEPVGSGCRGQLSAQRAVRGPSSQGVTSGGWMVFHRVVPAGWILAATVKREFLHTAGHWTGHTKISFPPQGLGTG